MSLPYFWLESGCTIILHLDLVSEIRLDTLENLLFTMLYIDFWGFVLPIDLDLSDLSSEG